jgi:hypothetical protein
MCHRAGLLIVGFGSLALLAGSVLADDAAKAAPGDKAKPADGAKSPAASESIEQLIEQLDAAEFKDREAACAKLAAKGKDAIPALEKAAANGNLEVSSRAATILGKLLKSSDEATENAALKSLHNLADGNSPAAARKAKSILEKKDGLQDNGQGMNLPGGIILPGNGFGGRIIINGGQLNIGGGATMKTMSVRNVNGVKEIETSEDGKTVKIQDDPAQGIKIEITEKENGKETTKKYEAKNVDDLKKNHPAGYELFKKYGGEQQGNGIQLNMNLQALPGNAIPGNAMPALPLLPAMPLIPGQAQPLIPGQAVPGGFVPQAGRSPVEAATRLVKSLSTRLETLQKTEAYKDATPESKAELKKQIEELSKRLEDVRGQLGDK